MMPITVHSMRASLKTWGLEHHYREIVTKQVLAHRQKDSILATNTRGSLFTERMAMMEQWGEYCGG